MRDAYALAYLVLAISMAWVLLGFLRRSEFGVLIAYAELFVFFGAFLYPALYYSGVVEPAVQGENFLNTTGQPGIATLLHVASYLLGAVFGLTLAQYATRQHHLKSVYRFAASLVKDEATFFRNALLAGIFALVSYLASVGWINAIAYAASMRSGIYDAINEYEQHFLFLKSLAVVFGFIVCFVPILLRTNENKIVMVLYALFAVMLYIVSVSRMLLLLQIVVPLLMYLRMKSKRFSTFVLCGALAVPLFLLFLFYGKPLGFVVFKAITDGEIVSIEPYLYEYGFLNAFFGNFEFIWFSIEAGTRNFFHFGQPLIPTDLILAFGGFVPSRVWTSLDLSLLDYRSVQEALSCINTRYFEAGCNIPPRELGFTAYLLPVSGAFILGAVKYFIFRRQEMYFLYIATIDYKKTWAPFLFVVMATMLFSAIPSTISQLAFLVLTLGVLFSVTKLLRAAATSQRT